MVVASRRWPRSALLVADVAASLLLRSYLVQRVDEQLSIEAPAGRRTRRCRSSRPRARRRGSGLRPAGRRASSTWHDGSATSDRGQPVSGSPTSAASPTLQGARRRRARSRCDAAPTARWRVEVGRPRRTQRLRGRRASRWREVDADRRTAAPHRRRGHLLVLVVHRRGRRHGGPARAAAADPDGGRPPPRSPAATCPAGSRTPTRTPSPGRLGTALNTMLVRIETAMAARTASEQRLRQFLADAAHELRTPLTSIQGFAELYRRGGAPPGPELDEAMGAIESEVGRMRLLVNDLLLLARLDEERPLERRPVDLLEVAADTVRDAHVRVPTRFVHARPAGRRRRDVRAGDRARRRGAGCARWRRTWSANALQHTPDDAEVVVRVGPARAPSAAVGADAARPPARGGRTELPAGVPVAVIEVVDTGPGHGAGRRRAGLRAALPGRPQPVPPPRRGRPRAVHRGRHRAGPRRAGASCGPRPGPAPGSGCCCRPPIRAVLSEDEADSEVALS